MSNAADAPYQPLIITDIRPETADTRTLLLQPADDAALAYEAGQYLTLVQEQYGQQVRRSYSISSSPALPEPLAITVKRIANGTFSRRLVDQAQVGDTLLTTGPAGFFTLPADSAPYQQVWLLAAGSGITPIFSLLKTLLATWPAVNAVLVYSNHSPATTIFHDALHQLAGQYPERLRIEWLYSNHPNLARARLYKDLLKALVHQHAAAAAPAQLLAYACGPLNYMRMCTYALRELGVPAAHIRKENFNAEPVFAAPLTPPDTEAHGVLIRWRGQEHRLRVQYPDTILQAAQRTGLRLPYSCQAGRCGNCVARCTAGRVWMSYNEVLTDRETSRGLVLTCTGYPVGGDVQLEVM